MKGQAGFGVRWLGGGLVLLVPAGCARQAATSRPASQPIGQTGDLPGERGAPEPGIPEGVEAERPSAPAEQPPLPATQPVKARTKPVEPRFEVTSLGPEGEEAHWIVVERWAKGAVKGTVFGRWVRPNKMEIDVNGAEQVVLKLGKLPIRAGTRIILRIEDANMELGRNLLPTVRLRRSSTGVWSAVKDN